VITNNSGTKMASLKAAVIVKKSNSGSPYQVDYVQLIEIADSFASQMDEDSSIMWWSTYKVSSK